MGESVKPGYFGKLPIRGDFLERDICREFIELLDAWIRTGLERAPLAIGPNWEEVYLEAPIWRFLLPASDSISVAHTGVMIASLDSVGRLFPMFIVYRLPVERVRASTIARLEDQLGRLADRLLELLLRDAYTVEDFQSAIALDLVLDDYDIERSMVLELSGRSMQEALADNMDLLRLGGELSMCWWTPGSDRVKPKALIGGAMDDPGLFERLFLEDMPAPMLSERAGVDASKHYELASHGDYRTLAFTVRGGRDENQDRYFMDSAAGIWAVMDGMGGHADGAYAAQVILDAFRAMDVSGTLEDRAKNVLAALEDAHQQIVKYSQATGATCGATVVALVLSVEGGWVGWCGDARLYKVSGIAEALTRDHVTDDPAQPGALTRAIGVGSAPQVEVAVISCAVKSDAFLLCSDGVYRSRHFASVVGFIGSADPEDAIRDALESISEDARDNATGIAVWPAIHGEGTRHEKP